jgi:hypothetical protein
MRNWEDFSLSLIIKKDVDTRILVETKKTKMQSELRGN